MDSESFECSPPRVLARAAAPSRPRRRRRRSDSPSATEISRRIGPVPFREDLLDYYSDTVSMNPFQDDLLDYFSDTVSMNPPSENPAAAPDISRYLKTGLHKSGECSGESFSDGLCVICLSDFSDGEELGFLECKHQFHASCIHSWLLRKNLCPVCKRTAVKELAA